jgi:hypothetical protein
MKTCGSITPAFAREPTPELCSENSIGSDPLPPRQAWVISFGGGDEGPGLYQVFNGPMDKHPVDPLDNQHALELRMPHAAS